MEYMALVVDTSPSMLAVTITEGQLVGLEYSILRNIIFLYLLASLRILALICSSYLFIH